VPQVRVIFATQVNSKIQSAVRELARKEGRQLQSPVNEALADPIEKRKDTRSSPQVMAAYFVGHD